MRDRMPRRQVICRLLERGDMGRLLERRDMGRRLRPVPIRLHPVRRLRRVGRRLLNRAARIPPRSAYSAGAASAPKPVRPKSCRSGAGSSMLSAGTV